MIEKPSVCCDILFLFLLCFCFMLSHLEPQDNYVNCERPQLGF